MGNAFVSLTARAHLGHLALVEGNWQEATRLLEESAGIPAGTVQIQRYIQRDLAQIDILAGRPRIAIDRLEPLIEDADPEDNDVVFLLPVLAWAYLENGNAARAAELASEAVDRATAQENALALVDGLRVQGMVLAGEERWAEAEHAFEESASLAHRMPYPYVEARALYEWGTIDAGRRQLGQAHERLQTALGIFQRLGAARDVERTEQALVSIGVP